MKMLLVGFGRSNRAVFKLLRGRVALTAVDDGEFAKSAQSVAENLDLFDVALISPGIPDNHPLVRLARLASVRTTNDLGFFLDFVPPNVKIIAVTGTNGKTTTVGLIGYMLRRLGLRVVLAGNNGNPLANAAKAFDKIDYLVVEISSFAAELLDCSRALDVLIYTSYSPNHLDRYVDERLYRLAKRRLVRKARVIVAESGAAEALKLEADVVLAENGDFAGAHNAVNRALAARALSSFGLETAELDLGGFRFPRFRQQIVYEDDRLLIVNDSKATSGAATLAAVRRFAGRPIFLIVGGRLKSDLSMLSGLPLKIFAYGPEAPLFQERLPSALVFADLRSAYRAAKGAAETAPGQAVILFSPAGSSLDYPDYIARGEAFSALVEQDGQ